MNPILAGILQGAGHAGTAIAGARKEAEDRARLARRDVLAEEQLTEQRRHNVALEGASITELPVEQIPAPFRPAGTVPGQTVKVSNSVLPLYKQMADLERRQRAGKAMAAGIPNAEDTMAFTAAEEGSGMQPVPAEPTARMVKAGLESGDLSIAEALPFLKPFLSPDLKPVSETTVGFLGPGGKYTPLPGAGQSAEPPAERAGFKVKTHIDARGRKSYTEEQALPRPERTLSERYAEAALRFKENPTDPQARADYEKSKLAFANEEKLAGLRASGAADARPLPDVTAQAIATHDNILASAQLLKTFTPEEVKTYSGLLNRPLQDVKLALQGMPSYCTV